MEKDCWFRNWFDSEYYHLLYNKRDDEEANFFINNLCTYLQLPTDARIWDIACGKGRHTIALAKKGYSVTGTDLSKNSIKEALSTSVANVEFYVHDMRKPLRVNYFDCVVNLFTSIGYFENYNDNLTVFKNVFSALKPGGVFVVDFFNSEKVKKAIQPEYVEQRGETTFFIKKTIKENTIRKHITFEKDSKTHEFEEMVTLLNKEDFLQFAKKSGFNLLDVFGNYSLESFDIDHSDRLILIFKK